MAKFIAQWPSRRPTKSELRFAHDSLTYMVERTQFAKIDKLLEDFSAKLMFSSCDAAHQIVSDYSNNNEFSLVNISVGEVKDEVEERRQCVSDAKTFLDLGFETGFLAQKEYDKGIKDLAATVAAHVAEGFGPEFFAMGLHRGDELDLDIATGRYSDRPDMGIEDSILDALQG